MRLMLVLALCAILPAASHAQLSDRLVATVDGFPITEQSTYGNASNLTDIIREISRSKLTLQRLGAGSSPKDVAKWRKAKEAEHRRRAQGLREMLKDPSRAKEIFAAHVSTGMYFEQWQSLSRRNSSAERIAKWENELHVGRHRLDLSKLPDTFDWRLLEAMAEELRQQGQAIRPAYMDALSKEDVELLRALGKPLTAGIPDLGPVVHLYGEEKKRAEQMVEAMSSSGLLMPIAKELEEHAQRDTLSALKISYHDAGIGKQAELHLKPRPLKHSRKQLLASMNTDEAMASLAEPDARASMALLFLAKSGKRAVPALLKGARSEEGWTAPLSMLLLGWLESREGAELVMEARLHRASKEETASSALSLVAAMSPNDLESLVRELVQDFEKDSFGKDNAMYAPKPVRQGLRLLAAQELTRGRSYLHACLKSPKPGMRFAAAQVLGDLKDDGAAPVAFDVLAGASQPYERHGPLRVLARLGSPKHAPALDALASKQNAPELAAAARYLEFDALPPHQRLAYAEKYVNAADRQIASWAFDRIFEGFQSGDPALPGIIERLSSKDGPHRERAMLVRAALQRRSQAR